MCESQGHQPYNGHSRLFASLLLRRLTLARERTIREEQADSRPGRGCIDHILTLRQILEQHRVYKQPTIAVSLDFKGAFDSVDRQVLLNTLARKGMPTKYVNIIRALYAQTSGQVRV
ncbi:reverse transcriptase domain-containing protein, partial [Acinetobacter baumannii]|uniref:reverse transcriptase domain-containing protein n=1 Tax=Acinetobacter baumannii TaxID=470 RepID=UPI0033986228